MRTWGSAWTERSNKSKKETQIIEQTIFKREERWTSKHTYACVFLPLHNHIAFSSLQRTKGTFVSRLSIYIYISILASPTSAKGSPSYTLLVMDTYSRASTWLRGLCLHCSQQAHTPYLLAAVKKQREKRRWCTGSLLLTVSHTKDKNTERNQDYSNRERCTSKQHCSDYYSNSRVSTEALLPHKSSIRPYKRS